MKTMTFSDNYTTCKQADNIVGLGQTYCIDGSQKTDRKVESEHDSDESEHASDGSEQADDSDGSEQADDSDGSEQADEQYDDKDILSDISNDIKSR